MRKLLLALLLFPVLVFAQINFTPPPVEVLPVTKQESNKDLKSHIQYAYPQIKSETYAANANTFNSLMQTIVQQQVQQFKNQLSKNQEPALPQIAAKNTLFITYDATTLLLADNKPFISVRFKTESYLSGMAHPTHTFQVVNFDLATGKQFVLADIFQPNANYLNSLATYSETLLKKRLPKNAFFADGVKAVPENYQNWNLHADGLQITFDEYKVAPYSFGPQIVLIPYTYLQTILLPALKACATSECAEVQ